MADTISFKRLILRAVLRQVSPTVIRLISVSAAPLMGTHEITGDAGEPAGRFHVHGGENVRRVQEYLHPFREHLIDWFHITMRLTVLRQQTKALQEEHPQTGAEVSKRLAGVKHLLWHGNAEEALERLADLLIELSLIQARSACAEKVADSVTEFETYIRNNREFIPNFGER